MSWNACPLAVCPEPPQGGFGLFEGTRIYPPPLEAPARRGTNETHEYSRTGTNRVWDGGENRTYTTYATCGTYKRDLGSRDSRTQPLGSGKNISVCYTESSFRRSEWLQLCFIPLEISTSEEWVMVPNYRVVNTPRQFLTGFMSSSLLG